MAQRSSALWLMVGVPVAAGIAAFCVSAWVIASIPDMAVTATALGAAGGADVPPYGMSAIRPCALRPPLARAGHSRACEHSRVALSLLGDRWGEGPARSVETSHPLPQEGEGWNRGEDENAG
jgi:hypothetical protein